MVHRFDLYWLDRCGIAIKRFRKHHFCDAVAVGRRLRRRPIITHVMVYGSALVTYLGHTSCYTTVRGPTLLRSVIGSGYVTFYRFSKCFLNVLIFHY